MYVSILSTPKTHPTGSLFFIASHWTSDCKACDALSKTQIINIKYIYIYFFTVDIYCIVIKILRRSGRLFPCA